MCIRDRYHAEYGRRGPHMHGCSIGGVVPSMPFVEQTIKWLGPVWTRRVPDLLVLINMGAGLYTVIRHPRSGLVCRRVFLLCAYLFLLRSVCVVLTSLPDMSDHCQAQFTDTQPGLSLIHI
eukprot:TRINITY_DN11740_c0_g1_i10.p1 TRINITY_DN11740_c0_g1~~TRINITY_DN11740_c0_g1_i10.p1  ORF type:complete len:121 (+),score=24.32 TRINITY_DN11740_c0_g1_i10:134-496(+)